MREDLQNRRRCYRENLRAGRRGRMPAFEYPPDMATDVPPFSAWLQTYVKHALDAAVDIDEDLVRIAQPPLRLALRFSRMWAYGNHFRTDNEQHCRRHSTYDSAICTIFTETIGGGDEGDSAGLAEATLQYVGILKEILVVSFGALKITLMRASWIPMENGNESPNRTRDQYGFFLVRHERRLPAMEAPYVFPSQVSQVIHFVGLCIKCAARTVRFRGLWLVHVPPPLCSGNCVCVCNIEGAFILGIVVLYNELTMLEHHGLNGQVFFIPDSHDRTWKVVVQKEARSRRVIEVGDEAILNGIGVYNALEAECVNDNAEQVEGGGEVGGELVDAADVQRVEIRFNRGERARGRAQQDHTMP